MKQIKQIKQMLEGWANVVFNSEEELSAHRMKICNECEYISTKHKTLRPDVHCTNCGCTLNAKTRCASCQCPIGKWKASNIKKE